MRQSQTLMIGAILAMLAATGVLLADDIGQAGARLVRADEGDMLARARAGDRIVLEPRDYGTLRVIGRRFDPAVTIVAGQARFSQIIVKQSSGVRIEGGTVIGPGGKSYGVTLNGVDNVQIDGMTITGAHRGIVIGGAHDLAIVNVRLDGLISDGIDVTQSQRVRISGAMCRNFAPNASQYDADGKRISSGDHPDCIQAWSKAGTAPVADVIVENVDAEGRMQGIFFGDKAPNGGFDRVIVRNNRIHVTYPNGIVLQNARDSVVTGNRVSTLPGGFNPRHPERRNRTNIRADGVGDRVCGNSIADFPGSPATDRCR